MIIRYQGHSLTVRERFQAERISLQLSERQSTATITLSDAAPALSVDEWISWETGPGAGIVWRVKTIDDQVEKRTRTITVEHTIQSLRDRVMFGEVKSKTISGTNANPTARQAVIYILSHQSDWALGDIAYNVTNPYSFNGDDLYSALETVSGSIQDCIWEYDFRQYPFRLYIRQMDSTVYSEMRTDRNIRTLKKTIDRSRMFTRFYPIGKNNLHIDGDYVSRNENLYGVVSKVETDQSISTKEALAAWANERLSRHSEPAVTVTISGLELEEVTGDPLDSFTIGKVCRVPLPEFSTQITERVTRLSYPDIIASPMEVTVTLANELQDVAKILQEQAAGGKKANRNHAKNGEEDHAWMVDTDTHIGLVAEAVAGEGADKDWSRVASIMVDGQGIHQRVVKTENELVTAWTAIEANEDAISLEAQKRSEEDGTLRGQIKVQADKIDLEVENRVSEDQALSGRITVQNEKIDLEVENRKSADDALSGRITVQSNKIALVVEETAGGDVIKAASIVTAINDEGSGVYIEADHVQISGNTKISGALTIENGALTVKRSAVIQGNLDLTTSGSYIQAGQYNVKSSGYVRFIGTGAGERYDLTCDTLKGMIKSFSVSGDVLTLTPFYGEPVNFSKAAAVIVGSWSGTTYTVTGGITPISTTVYSQIEGALNPNATVYAKIYHDNPSDQTKVCVTTEMTLEENASGKYVELYTGSKADHSNIQKGKVSTTATYNAGWDYGQTQIARTTRAATGQETTIKTLDYEERFTIVDTYTKSNGTTSEIKYTLAAKADRYLVGYQKAYNLVELPGNGTSDSFVVKVPITNDGGQISKTFTMIQGTPSAYGYVYVNLEGGIVARASVGEWYTAGYDMARGLIEFPGAGTGDTFVVKTPNAARNGQDSYTFNMTQGTPASSGFAAVSLSGTVVARISLDAWYNKGWHDFFYDNSGVWNGCWLCETTDATHGVVAGKHYVTGPADTPGGGWAKFYCVEDIAAQAGIVEKHDKSRTIYCSDAKSEQVPGAGTVWTFTYTQTSQQNNPIIPKGRSRTVYW